MPGFDGAGPRGQGAFTGGGRGYCAVTLNDAQKGTVAGSALSGMGGYGRGNRNRFYATGIPGCMRGRPFAFADGRLRYGGLGRMLSKEDELAALKSQSDYLKSELDAIQARVQYLETK